MIIPTEKTLTAEIQSRIRQLDAKREELKLVNTPESTFVSTIMDYEKQILIEAHGLVMWYARKGAQETVTGLTLIKDVNGLPLCIGDKVKKHDEISGDRCGTLEWDGYRKQFFLRTADGGSIQIGPSNLERIEELFDFDVDTTKTECRQRPNKKKW